MVKKTLDRRGEVLGKAENVFQQASSFVSWMVSDSIHLKKSQKAGFVFTVMIFGIILSPVAASPSDPYHLQELGGKLWSFLLVFSEYEESNANDGEYEIIDGVRYKVFFSGKIDMKNPDGKKYLVPGINDVIGKRF